MRSDARGYPWWPGAIRSTQGPDTEAQTSHCHSEESACNARPVHTDGSHPEELTVSISSPLHPRRADIERTLPDVREVPLPVVSRCSNTRSHRTAHHSITSLAMAAPRVAQ